MKQQLRHHAIGDNKIGQRDVFHLQQPLHNRICQLAAVAPIAYHLRRADQGSLKRGGSGRDDSRPRILQQSGRRAEDYLQTLVLSHLPIESLRDGRRGRHDILIVGEISRGLDHDGEIVANLAHP